MAAENNHQVPQPDLNEFKTLLNTYTTIKKQLPKTIEDWMKGAKLLVDEQLNTLAPDDSRRDWNSVKENEDYEALSKACELGMVDLVDAIFGFVLSQERPEKDLTQRIKQNIHHRGDDESIQEGGKEWDWGQTDIPLLFLASEHNQLDMVRLLLTLGADPNYRGMEDETFYSYSPLYIACQRSHTECAHILLKAGAIGDVLCRGDDNNSYAIKEICKNGNLPLLQLLYTFAQNKNWNRDFTAFFESNDGESHWHLAHIAYDCGHLAIAKFMLQHPLFQTLGVNDILEQGSINNLNENVSRLEVGCRTGDAEWVKLVLNTASRCEATAKFPNVEAAIQQAAREIFEKICTSYYANHNPVILTLLAAYGAIEGTEGQVMLQRLPLPRDEPKLGWRPNAANHALWPESFRFVMIAALSLTLDNAGQARYPQSHWWRLPLELQYYIFEFLAHDWLSENPLPVAAPALTTDSAIEELDVDAFFADNVLAAPAAMALAAPGAVGMFAGHGTAHTGENDGASMAMAP